MTKSIQAWESFMFDRYRKVNQIANYNSLCGLMYEYTWYSDFHDQVYQTQPH